MALHSSPDQPIAVRTVAQAIGTWIGRLGAIWIEGQVAQLTRRPGAGSVWLVLRDTEAEMSLSVVTRAALVEAIAPPLAEGARVVVYAKPEFWTGRGQLQLRATDIRPVGIGDLLAQLARLTALLAAEGLFAAHRKKPLPFVPRRIGLISGRASAAMRDVMINASARWPAARFEVREVAVQGVQAVTSVCAAIQELDAHPEVDVIVIARGGGSVEDLLPFSNEGLIRVVAAATTPIVSAIGHEQDQPILDLVADVRASTPTDAARRIVPDVAAEQRAVTDALTRCRRAVAARVDADLRWLAQTRARPCLADPAAGIAAAGRTVADLRHRSGRAVDNEVTRGHDQLGHVLARIRSLSPAATLERGYAVVQLPDGSVVRDPDQVPAGGQLWVRVAAGHLHAARIA